MNTPTLLDLEKANKQYQRYYVGSGVLAHAKRIFRYPTKYGLRVLSRVRVLPRTLKIRSKTFWGKNITILLGDSNAGALYYFGYLPRQEYRLTRFFLSNIKPQDVFYDIGANYGFYALLASTLTFKGETHAFEPHPLVFTCMEHTFAGMKAVFLNNTALADRKGNISFFDGYVGGHSGGSTTREEIIEDKEKYKKIQVLATTLNEYSKSHTPPTVIKIDVEGAEEQVLRGGMNTIQQHKPLVVLECWGKNHWNQYSEPAVALMIKWGYKPYVLNEEGIPSVMTLEKLEDWVSEHSYDNIVFQI